jgi:UDP-N-acetylglucosamine/UDP-N-acetylgalactosamine diphosphorylase
MIGKEIQKKLEKLLKKHNQEHILRFWGELSIPQKQDLSTQIKKLNFDKIDEWVSNLVKKSTSAPLHREYAPPAFYNATPADTKNERKYVQAIELGKKLIAAGKVAAFVVAGGQGTRLKFDGPKGNFPISPVKNKTFFQISAETITAASKKYQTDCPWYIMTSPQNHSETIEIFRSNDYYGLDPESVFIFQQGTLPNFGLDGAILLADKATISRSPDGHGGSIKALYQSGALEDMKKRGIEFISYWQIDNALINIFDPLFVGLHALDNAEMSAKATIKTGPKEKVGNFCLVDGKVTVIEYSDLPDDLAEKRNPDGSLVFKLGSIGIHIINTSFVERLNARDFALPLHRAIKVIPHVDQDGNFIKPTEPNGVKLETFVFDALPLASKVVILETIRSQEFAPTKNLTGVDSVDTTRQMMVARAVDWLKSAGIPVPRKPDPELASGIDCLIEIAPSFALYKDDIKEKLDHIPAIKPNDKIYLE